MATNSVVHPDAPPIKYSGKWVAWDAAHSRIVAHASTIQELWVIAAEQKIDDPIFEKIPRCDTRFVGMQ